MSGLRNGMDDDDGSVFRCTILLATECYSLLCIVDQRSFVRSFDRPSIVHLSICSFHYSTSLNHVCPLKKLAVTHSSTSSRLGMVVGS
mmetsp:Transcript_1219/g.2665  ORF Transcript_1219/g.2665 Transcript_1219/m.2665 type:complete len:88 (+) Transcript_1219:295-558(+)